MSKPELSELTFKDLGLPDTLQQALDAVGYEIPSPIQAQAIPFLLEGKDVLGHAPTGTGKTAAFALPLLARLDLKSRHVQVLVLTPTRELAIQVSEAFRRYANHLPGFHVMPIYGGQEYSGQIRALKRGLHVVVGTPGRVMDHMRKGTLDLGHLQALVLDEADEMLRMGFIDDVKWILDQTPDKRQIALFSATMPKEVERIARTYLNDPKDISIKAKTATAESIRQRYWLVNNLHKLDALTRILEVEPFDAVLLFVRTKTMTLELSERLEARGYAVAALNGDIVQKVREQTVNRLKKGDIDILVATDVAARGLDVERISHVVNYDIPYDTEAYIHRIGRTGRAGRTGEAILFVAPREQRMLAAIERATRQKIEPMVLPTTEMVNSQRISKFKQSITDALSLGDLDFMTNILDQYVMEHDVPPIEIAAALAKLAMGEKPLLLEEERSKRKKPARDEQRPNDRSRQVDARPADGRRPDPRQADSGRPESRQSRTIERKRAPKKVDDSLPPEGMERFRIEVGYDHEVKPGNIVGAIANEAGLDATHIGHINIYESFSHVDLPLGMPTAVFNELKKVWVTGRPLNISRLVEKPKKEYRKDADKSEGPGKTPDRKKPAKKKHQARADAAAKPKKPRKPKPKA